MKNPRLKSYRNRVWDEIQRLSSFSIQAIPREQNARADLIVVSSSLLLPHLVSKDKGFKVEVIFKPNITENVETWKVFNEDKKIQCFIEGAKSFTNQYFEGSESPNQDFSPDRKKYFELVLKKVKKVIRFPCI